LAGGSPVLVSSAMMGLSQRGHIHRLAIQIARAQPEKASKSSNQLAHALRAGGDYFEESRDFAVELRPIVLVDDLGEPADGAHRARRSWEME